LQLEGARGKLKGYQTDQMGKQAWRGQKGPSHLDPQPF
jgi:hypothetical protein